MVHFFRLLCTIAFFFGKQTVEAVLLRKADRNASRDAGVARGVHHEDKLQNATRSNTTRQMPTFPSYVETVTTGRGIWKWSNALEAYERHLEWYKGKAVKLGEVGVWSGGSLIMWHAVLGPKTYVYGMDISKDALNFNDPPKTTITLLDQGNSVHWAHFFSTVCPKLDVLIDDGGHTSPLMLTTTISVWPHISDGGVLAIEDIHGAHHLEEFFVPVAHYYGGAGRPSLAALHTYPFLLIAEKVSTERTLFVPQTTVQPATRVATMEELPGAVSAALPGSHVVLENAAWGDFLAAATVSAIFRWFNGLHTPAAMFDVPQGCALTNSPICSSRITNSAQQDKIYGLHIYPSKLLIEVAAMPPVIQAVRHGTEWMKYPTHS